MINSIFGALGAAAGITEGVIRAFLYPSRSGAGATEVEATANSTHLSATLQKGSQRFEPRLVALIPLLVVGDSGVGKTSFVLHYLDGLWPHVPNPTIGADLYTQRLVADEQLTLLQIWDVGSDEQAELLGSQFYDSAAGAVIVCRLGTAACLDGLTHWHQKLCQISASLPIVVVATTGVESDSDQPITQGLQVPQDVIMWCNSNGIHLYVKAGWQDHQASIAAINDLTLRAITYNQQKTKPRRKSFSSKTYPELFQLLNSGE